MAIIRSDWSGELEQVKSAAKEVVDGQLAPMINDALGRAGQELKGVVGEASDQLQINLQKLADEVHSQRKLTSDEIKKLIDYAADRMAQTMDDRLAKAKLEASAFMTEKVDLVKAELAQAAKQSRRTLYMNIGISMTVALGMALVSFLYKKLNTGELDLLAVFRVLLLSTGTGAGILSLLKMVAQWRGMSIPQKNVASIAITQLSVLRPNGAMGPFLLSVAMFLAWFGVTFLVR